ncbi:MAG TPA: two-component regulator propeller domain-containing protein [Chryseosolibacter sp.]|nr:two-component regulator propeller domain-containing protein [Chryseosolibacter sp.]
MRTRLVLIPFLLFLSPFVFSQAPHFRKHTLPQEFKNAHVNHILQDQKHFMWFATSIGLIRFDGHSYKLYLQFSDGNDATVLFESSDGTLYSGYNDGKIGTWREGAFVSVLQIPGFGGAPITGIIEDRDRRVWVSSYGKGMAVIAGGQITHIDRSRGLADEFIYCLARAGDGRILAGTDRGISVCSFDGKLTRVDVLTTENGLTDNIVTALSVATDGTVWVGTDSEGICSLDLRSARFRRVADPWNHGRVTTILPLEHTIWVGSAMHGVFEVDNAGSFVNEINREDRKLPMRVSDLCSDEEGNIWIGGPGNALFSGNRTFSFITEFNGNDISNIQAVLCARDGRLWFTTAQGAYSIAQLKSREHVPLKLTDEKLVGAQIISLFQDAAGYIWMGTFDHGVFRYDASSGSLLQLTEQQGLINNNVLSIAGRDNEVWLATLGGVSQCTVGGPADKPVFKFNNYTTESGLGSNYIYKIFIDSRDRVWFATDGKGVTVREDSTFRNFSLNEGLKSNIVYSVTEDASGAIWLSTSNAGIYKFNGSRFEPFMPHNGLRDLAISSIIGEKNGNILVVSKAGIDILDPSSGVIFYHGEEFGMTEIDPNLNAYSKDSAGNVWVGARNGIIRYATNIPPMRKWPVTEINEVQVFLSKIDTSANVFEHDQNHVSVSYMGFWYHDPAEVTYRLKLEGHDREWVDSRNHFITYPNLQPGSYTFMVQSSATNYFEGAPVRKFTFTIRPPFYSASWFYLLCAVATGGLLFLFIRRREKKIQAAEREKKEKIEFQFQTLKNQINPHFLFNSFNTLIGVIEEDRETAVSYVEKLSDFYREIILHREKDLIPLSKELELIDNYYFLQLKRYKKNFRMHAAVPDEKLQHRIPPLTLQLLVENAIKHNIISNDRPLVVEIFTEGDYLVVRNNLQRKVVHESSTGLGLNNIMNRFKLLTERKVSIRESEEYFSVYVPLLNPGNDESSHH